MGTAVKSTGLPDPSFWSGRRVLITGHTGFKGSWLTAWLTRLGAEVAGVALPAAPTEPSLWAQLALPLTMDIRADIRGQDWQEHAVAFAPHVVFHLAAQPLVSAGWESPLETFDVNVMGTAQLMQLLPRLTQAVATVVVTTDKVYEESNAICTEGAPLGGDDPYAASKACAELVVRAWPQPGHKVVTARAGNVIGGGDWADDRLFPDLIRAWSKGDAVTLRRPEAVRPWQHVLEPLAGYLVYAEAAAARRDVPRSLNFGPSATQEVSVEDLANHAADEWARLTGTSRPEVQTLRRPGLTESGYLAIDSTEAFTALDWSSRLTWQQAATLTVAWFARLADGSSVAELVQEQIAAYALETA